MISSISFRLRLLVLLAVTTAQAAATQTPGGDGSVRLQLVADTVIAGVRCGPTGRAFAVIHANGSLDECPLAADTVIEGHALPRGTWLRLLSDRTLDGAWLPHDVTLQGIPCKGTGYKGWSVRFHPTGALKLCFLSRDAEIGGVRCRRGTFFAELSGSTAVSLDARGRLLRCRRRT